MNHLYARIASPDSQARKISRIADPEKLEFITSPLQFTGKMSWTPDSLRASCIAGQDRVRIGSTRAVTNHWDQYLPKIWYAGIFISTYQSSVLCSSVPRHLTQPWHDDGVIECWDILKHR